MKKKFLNLMRCFLIIFAFSCKKKSDSVPLNTTNSSDIRIYKENALTKGDTSAYNQLSNDYADSPYEGFLNTAKIMADKYNYHQAYLDVYYCSTDYYHKKSFTELDGLKEQKKILALKYLRVGAEKGNKTCQNILGHYYLEGRFIELDSIKGRELIKLSGVE